MALSAPCIIMPPTLASRPQQGGLPVLYVTHMRPDGTPDFRVNDPGRVLDAMGKRLCGICGQPLGRWVCWFGRKVVLDNYRMFPEPGSHEGCVRYAFAVCPYLTAKHERREVGLPQDVVEGVFHAQRLPNADIYLGWTHGYDYLLHDGVWYARAQRFRRLEVLRGAEEGPC